MQVFKKLVIVAFFKRWKSTIDVSIVFLRGFRGLTQGHNRGLIY